MSKIKWLLILLMSAINIYSQQSKPVNNNYWYKCMTGKIDKYAITMHLYRAGNNFSGSYYYNNVEKPIQFSGQYHKGNLLTVTAYSKPSDDDNDDEAFEGVFSDSVFSGTWKSKGKLFPFRVVRKTDSSSLAFDYIVSTGTKKLVNKTDDFMRDELSFDAASVWPAANSKHLCIPLIKRIILQSFGEKDFKGDIGKLFLLQRKELLYPSPSTDDKEQPTYATDDRLQVIYQSKTLLTLQHFNYSDYGGAHGMHGTSYSNIDLANNKEIQLADVIDTVKAVSVLEKLLEKQFRKDYNIKNSEPLGETLLVDKIRVTDNIFVTSKGIGFGYVPYEIGAFALGDILIYIPYKDIEAYLKPTFKKLIQ